MLKLLYIQGLLLLVSSISHAKSEVGRCPKPSTQANFDISQYTGLWYEINRNENAPFEKGYTCSTAEYSVSAKGKLEILNKGTRPNGKPNSVKATGKCEGSKCNIKFFPVMPPA